MSTFAVRLCDLEGHRGVLVRLFGRHLQRRRAVNLTLVIDVSGSMSRAASMPSSTGDTTETYAFSLLDVVKHACKTICYQLNDNDVLSLVTFSTNSAVAFAPQRMTSSGINNFVSMLDHLVPDQQTNLFAGIRLGVDTLFHAADIADPDALHHVIVLTDGESNMCPVIGNVEAVRKLFESKKQQKFSFTLNTLALGFDEMQSKELAQLAHICNQGGFTYIPDMGMVGSVFVNLLSSIFSTVEQNINITVDDNTDCAKIVSVPLLQSGQVIDVWIPTKSVEQVDIAVNLPQEDLSFAAQVEVALTDEDAVLAHAHRELLKVLEDRADRTFSTSKSDAFVYPSWCTADLMRNLPVFIDMNSEGLKALQPVFYAKWGRHYLQSLYSAHWRRVCNNFKDKGVQQYATEFFKTCQSQGDRVFNLLPPPPPTKSSGKVIYTSCGLNSKDNPCVGFFSDVLMGDGKTTKAACDIVKGDVVRTQDTWDKDGKLVNTATIECVVETLCPRGEARMCVLPTGLIVTPYHPVSRTAALEFKFPCDMAKPKNVSCPAVYSFLLKESDPGTTMIIDDTYVVVLGNEIVSGLAKHPFFSSHEKVSAALQECQGWENGYIRFRHNPLTRDPVTGLANGFDKTKEIIPT